MVMLRTVFTLVTLFFLSVSALADDVRTVKVGIPQNPPLAIQHLDGKPEGLVVDVLNDIAAENHWTLEYVQDSWPGLLEMLEKGEIDILTGIAYSEDRARRFDFSNEALASNWGVVYRNPSIEINSVLSLQGKRIALVPKSTHSRTLQDLLRKFGVTYTIIPAKNYTETLKFIVEDSADVAVVSRLFGILHTSEFNVARTSINFNPVEIRFAAPKGTNVDTLAAIDRYLSVQKNSANSNYHHFLNRWTDAPIRGGVPVWVFWVIGGIVIFLCVTWIIVAWLRYEVKTRTKELRKSEGRFKDFAESSSDWFWELDEHLRFSYISEGYRDSVKIDPSVFIGMTRQDASADSTNDEKWIQHFDDMENRRPFRNFIYKLETPDGAHATIRINGMPVFNHAGAFVGYRGTGSDITVQKRAEKAMLDSEARLRSILHNLPMPIYLKDMDKRYLEANSQYEKNYGVKLKGIIGKTSLEVFQDEYGKQFYDHDMAVLKAQDTIIREELIGGKTFTTLKFPILGNDGTIVGIGGIESDITERKNFENLLLNVAEGVSGAIGKTFFDTLLLLLLSSIKMDYGFIGKLSKSRESIETISFCSKNKIADNFVYQLKGAPCENVVGKSLKIYEKGVTECFPEDQMLKKMVIEGYAGYPLFDSKGQPLGILVVLSKAPMHFPEIAISLLRIFSVRAAIEFEREMIFEEIKLSKEEAEKANKAKSEFLASMSHELRTPLNAVLGFAQMMQFSPNTTLSPTQNEYVENILEGGSHLLELVNEILDLASIEADQIDLSLIDLEANDVVSNCVDLVTRLGEARSIKIIDQFSNGPPVLLFTDRTRFKQVLINLLSNAIKFNKNGGTVIVEGTETDYGYLRILVIDTGIGIAKKDLSSVFSLFHRADADPMVAKEGTGIGLTVTKLLVERMAGRIGFKSEAGIGSTFWVELPLASNDDVVIWTDAIEVGVDALNKDDQILVSMLNRLMCLAADDPDVDNIINELIEYTQYHFSREEAIMEACGYLGFERHYNLHRRLIDDVNLHAEAWRNERNQENLNQFRKFLKDWLFNHILKEDTKIAISAKGKGLEIRLKLEALGLLR